MAQVYRIIVHIHSCGRRDVLLVYWAYIHRLITG